MQFLKALFWIVIGGVLVLGSFANWHNVTLDFWSDIQVDIKLPVLIAFMFLLGWLPTFLIYRAKIWRMRHRLDSLERQQAAPVHEVPQVEEAPVI